MTYPLSHLDELEAESIFILREVKEQFQKPYLLFSGGKDSICLHHLAKKAFHPNSSPFPLLHIDTGHNFDETLKFRDELVRKDRLKLIVRTVEDSIQSGRIPQTEVLGSSRNQLQSVTLKDAIFELHIDCAIGGARRDEEKSRAKERIFSHRDIGGQWKPHSQRPEIFSHYNTLHLKGEHFRAFPLSHWTELDVWHYIEREQIAIPSIYFSHTRKCVEKNGAILAHADFLNTKDLSPAYEAEVRCRTVGDISCTGLLRSKAKTVKEIIEELKSTPTGERSCRIDDRFSETAMEDRKLEGYF